MKALRKIQTVDHEGKLLIEVPKEFGSTVEIIVFPVQRETENWTGEEWEKFSLNRFINTGDDTGVDWEDFFAVKDR